jgi:hypothetical protein
MVRLGQGLSKNVGDGKRPQTAQARSRMKNYGMDMSTHSIQPNFFKERLRRQEA